MLSWRNNFQRNERHSKAATLNPLHSINYVLCSCSFFEHTKLFLDCWVRVVLGKDEPGPLLLRHEDVVLCYSQRAGYPKELAQKRFPVPPINITPCNALSSLTTILNNIHHFTRAQCICTCKSPLYVPECTVTQVLVCPATRKKSSTTSSIPSQHNQTKYQSTYQFLFWLAYSIVERTPTVLFGARHFSFRAWARHCASVYHNRLFWSSFGAVVARNMLRIVLTRSDLFMDSKLSKMLV